MRRKGCNEPSATWALVGLFLLTTALIARSQPAKGSLQSQKTADQLTKQDSAPPRKPSMFDFANYKRLFKRSYSGLLEEAVRMKYFFARAFRVFMTATKYRNGELLYYFAINDFSDASPGELDMMSNKMLSKTAGVASSEPKERPTTSVDFHSLELGDNVDDSSRKLAEEHQDEPVLGELDTFLDEPGELKRRKRRDISSQERRDLPMSKLINTGSDVQEAPAKLVNGVPSNKPAYKPLESETSSLIDQLQPIEFFSFDSTPVQSDAIELGLIEALPSATRQKRNWRGHLPDEVFVDLRASSKCLSLPRAQGKHCGACYAFAAITIAEWLYCMETGELVPFSEQYMIDCGKQYIEGLDGCAGGELPCGAVFLQNFGLELLDSYQYLGRQGQCPYNETDPLEATGYIRTGKLELFIMTLKEMAYLIENGPIFVSLNAGRSLVEYGGGVHSIHCGSKLEANHAAVVVGHGRENGREYWLIRNSYGVGWGEGGYYKLDKLAGGICEGLGEAFYTKTGLVSKMNAYTNPDNKPIARHTPDTWANLNPDSLPPVEDSGSEVINFLNWFGNSVEVSFSAEDNY